jgi:hypothetical protein
MGELVADFADNLPCSEKKVALDVVAVHCATREEQKAELDAASVVDWIATVVAPAWENSGSQGKIL